MPTMLSDHPWMCLLPSMVTLTFAILSRRIILSMFLGICSAAILLKGFSMVSISCVVTNLVHVFYTDGHLKTDEIILLLFLWMMGIVTYITTRSGSVGAFTKAILTKVKDRKGGQLFVIFLGMLIFIDDYLNSLVVGNVSRPICKRLGISKAKLAYLLDSTAAPVCVLVPLSSWGSAIIATLQQEVHQYALESTSLSYFLGAAAYNFYPILTLVVLVLVVLWKLDIGPMQRHESAAMQEAAPSKEEEKEGKVDWIDALKVLYPVVTLVVVCMVSLYITGKVSSGASLFSWMKIFNAAQLEVSLLLGGIASIVSCFWVFERREKGVKGLYIDLREGFKIMQEVMVILIFSWALANLSKDLEVGQYIASFIESHDHISLRYMPVVIFLIASLASVATGSSWSTFSLMLPIVFQICVNSDLAYLMPMLAACLGGSVFGDHCSPISDTTILSSLGADCHHMDHVLTQLPYCIGVALVSLGCYVILGLTGSLWQAYAFGIACLMLLSGVVVGVRRVLGKQ